MQSKSGRQRESDVMSDAIQLADDILYTNLNFLYDCFGESIMTYLRSFIKILKGI